MNADWYAALTDQECPHCGWTPAEQDKLSNDRQELLAALRNAVDCLDLYCEHPEAQRISYEARAAIASVEGK